MRADTGRPESVSKRQRGARTPVSAGNHAANSAVFPSPASSTTTMPPSPLSAISNGSTSPTTISPVPMPEAFKRGRTLGHGYPSTSPSSSATLSPSAAAASPVVPTPAPSSATAAGRATSMATSAGMKAVSTSALAAAGAAAAAASALKSVAGALMGMAGDNGTPGAATAYGLPTPISPAAAPSTPSSAAGASTPAIAQAVPPPRPSSIASCVPAATAWPAPMAARASAATPASASSIFPPATSPTASSARRHQQGSAHVAVITDLLAATLTVGHHTPLSVTFASYASNKVLGSLMDVDPALETDTAEMLSEALGLKLGCSLTISDDAGEDGDDDGDDRRTEKVGADAAFARAITEIKKEQSAALRAREMNADEEEADWMEVEDLVAVKVDAMDVDKEIAEADKMEVEGEEEARRRQAEMRALLNEGRGSRSRRRCSAALAKTRGSSLPSRDRFNLSLRKKWKAGKLLTL